MDPVISAATRTLRRAAVVIDEEELDEGDTSPFHGGFQSPPELQTPDLSRTKRLDREQEDRGLDTPRRVEDVEPVGMSERRRSDVVHMANSVARTAQSYARIRRARTLVRAAARRIIPTAGM